jgi:hypothetical protein
MREDVQMVRFDVGEAWPTPSVSASGTYEMQMTEEELAEFERVSEAYNQWANRFAAAYQSQKQRRGV